MNRRLVEILSGLGLFLLLWGAIYWLAQLNWLIPQPVIEWLLQSANRQQALLAFGAMVSGAILILVRLGISLPIPFLKAIQESPKVGKYLTGLPMWASMIILFVAFLAFLPVFPACQPPTLITFKVTGHEPLQPSDILRVVPGEVLHISATQDDQDANLACQWQYAGDAFGTFGQARGCDIQLKASGQPGEGYLTLLASKNFCNQSSIFFLRVEVTSQP
jgi:hypothetical protein